MHVRRSSWLQIRQDCLDCCLKCMRQTGERVDITTHTGIVVLPGSAWLEASDKASQTSLPVRERTVQGHAQQQHVWKSWWHQ